MAYSSDLVQRLTKQIVADLDNDVRKMVSGSQADAHAYAVEISRKSANNIIRHTNDECNSNVLSAEELSYLDSFCNPDIIDADFREIDSSQSGAVGFPNRSVSYPNPVGGSGFTDSTSDRNTGFSGGTTESFQRGSWKQPTEEDMSKFMDMGRKFAQQRKREADDIYYSGATDYERACPTDEEIRKRMENFESFKRDSAKNVRNNERQQKAEKEFYKSCILTDFNGVEKSYKVVRRNCNLTLDDFVENDPMYNIGVLRRALTREVLHLVGDWSRVKDIYVRSEQLIVNGVQCIPAIPSKVRGSLPFDTVELIENGCFASIFNWSALRYMKNLFVLDIDDEYLFRTTVADDLKLSRGIGIKSVLKFCPRLEHLIVNGVDFCAPDDSEDVVIAKKSLARGKHFDNLFDGMEFDLYGGTYGLRKWTANNFRDYANSRGNKGLLRYCGGLLTRGIVAGFGFVPDLAVHLGGGLIKGVKSFFTGGEPRIE